MSYIYMMVIDTVHSSGVGRMHGGMKIARPFQAPEAKLILTPGMVAEKKGGDLGLDSNSRPGLVIRRRIMVRQADEAAAGGFPRRATSALSNQPNVALTTSVNHAHGKSMDHSPKQQCDITRSSSTTTTTTTQDQSGPAMTKPAKTLRLFDLNKLPTVQENVFSPASSTIDSADSVTTDHHAAMATRPSFYPVDTDVFFGSSPSMKRLRDSEGGALAVDLGVLTPLASENNQQNFAFRKQVQAGDYNNSDVPTPTRKRLRKLSEYADRGHFSSTTGSMAKSWTTGDGDGCNNRGDVIKTLPAASPSSQADAKVRRRCPDVDEEVYSAVATLLMLSSSSARRELRFSSNVEASADSRMDEEERRDLATASDNEDPSPSLGSGSSVLLRPRNKQRYRSMAEIMAQTPILRRRVGS